MWIIGSPLGATRHKHGLIGKSLINREVYMFHFKEDYYNGN